MIIWAIIFFVIALVLGAIGWFFTTSRRRYADQNAVRIEEHRERIARLKQENPYRSYEETPKYDPPMSGFWFLMGALLSLAVAAVFFLFAINFQVDTGETKVLKSWSGVINQTAVVEPGFHTKNPFEDGITWNIKNVSTMFSGKNGTTTHDGQEVNGAQIEFIDKDGIKGWLDIQVITSIKPQDTVRLTSEYGSQEAFTITVLENDVKSLPRDVISGYTTVRMFEERTQLRKDVFNKLKESWAEEGIIVDKVNIHGIRYPKDVQQRFKDAQNAKTDLLKAETEASIAKTKAKGEADAAIEKANGEAQANNTLAASLTPQILQQRWIDAVTGANTIIVPQDFTSLGNLSGGAQ